MIKTTQSDPGQYVQMPGTRNELNARRESRLSNDAKGSSNGNTKEFGDGHRRASGQQKGLSAALFQRFTLFERQLLEAGSSQLHHGGDHRGGDHGDTKAGEGVVQILFESTPTGRNDGPASVSPQSLRSSIDVRVERIFTQVALQVEAAIRPGPYITSGPIRISIPMGATGSGLTSIEIAVDDGLVAVKLCLSAVPTPGDVGQQLLAAAGQLGQMLQAHLPGRRIKIVQSSPALDNTHNEIARLSGREGAAIAAFGFMGENESE